MFEKHFGLSENPFLTGPQTKFLYPSLAHQEAVANVRHAIRNREPFVVLITGEPGVGKSLAVQDALAEGGARAKIALITNPALRSDELIHEIGVRLGQGAEGAILTPSDLEQHLIELRAAGGTTFLLIDEAQHLDAGLLNELSVLIDLASDGESLLQIIVIGQPALEVKLAGADLRPLNDRIGPRYHVEPLGAAETAQYIHHRVAVAGGDAQQLFPADTCAKVHSVTRGIPGAINSVAGGALHRAFAAGSHAVMPEHVPDPEPVTENRAAAREDNAFLTPHPGHLSTEGGIDMARALSPELFASQAEPAQSESAKPADDDAERILPSWFDEIIARRKGGDEAPTPVAPTPAPTAATPVPVVPTPAPDAAQHAPVFAQPADPPATPIMPAAPVAPEPAPVAEVAVAAQAQAPAVGALPNFLQTPPSPVVEPAPVADEPEMAPADEAPAELDAPVEALEPVANGESASTEQAEVMASVDAALAQLSPHEATPDSVESLETIPPTAQPAIGRVALPPPEAIDFVERRGEFPQQVGPRPVVKPATNAGWPIAAALVACVIICAVLIAKLLPITLRQSLLPPTPTSAPPAVQTPSPEVPEPPATTPTKATPKAGTKSATKAGAKVDAKAARPAEKPALPAAKKAAAVTAIATPKVQPAAATTSKPPAASLQSYGIAVGEFLFEERANDRMTKLSDATGLPSIVVTVSNDDGSVYRVVIGSFSSRSAAEQKADELIERGLVQEARVTPLAKAVSKN